MINSPNQPQPTDVVLGGTVPPPITGAVLGGLEGIKHRLGKGEIQDQIATLAAALTYGIPGQALVDQQERLGSPLIKTAIALLKPYEAKPPTFQMVLESQGFEFGVVTVDTQGQAGRPLFHQGLVFTEPGAGGMPLVAIPPGEFWMGTSDCERGALLQELLVHGVEREEAEAWLNRERPPHQETVSGFFMGQYPVTQGQWRWVATTLPAVQRQLEAEPAYFKGADRPVEQVSWEEAVEFCDRLAHHTHRPYRLPTEAEWEYACRAGTTTPFYFGERLTPDFANCHDDEYGGDTLGGKGRLETTRVGSFPANGFGLYDLHGNVLEWCADLWQEPDPEATEEELAWVRHGLRGGSWKDYPRDCRSAHRLGLKQDGQYFDVGFRVVCS